MITLFIDTSSIDVSIAILKENTILSSITKEIPNQHSIYTVPFMEECLTKANLKVEDIQKIMVVTGPGSFTGLRIGVTIAKTYAYLKKIPVVAVSSLKMRALSCPPSCILSLMDAHHDNYYLGLYDANRKELIPEQFARKAKVLELIQKYQPQIIANEEIQMDDLKISKQPLLFDKIVTYYQDQPSENCHLLLPNYLKLPQALEEKHD